MPQIQKRTMGWLPKQSAYNEMQTWRARRQAAADSFINTSTALNAAFADINDNHMSGLVDITIRGAVNRVNAQAQAKLAASIASRSSSSSSSVDLTA